MRPIRSPQANFAASVGWLSALGGCSLPNSASPRLVLPSKQLVSPLRLLVDAFVNTFGITPPTPATEAKAGRVIAIMLAGVLVLLGVVAWMLRAAFTR
jgi:hypothetical protein